MRVKRLAELQDRQRPAGDLHGDVRELRREALFAREFGAERFRRGELVRQLSADRLLAADTLARDRQFAHVLLERLQFGRLRGRRRGGSVRCRCGETSGEQGSAEQVAGGAAGVCGAG
jgi:hypothetical protein